MATLVTDPELIKRLRKKQQAPVKPEGVVINPELIETLDKKREAQIAKAPSELDPTSKSSVVKEGSVVGDFGRTAASIASGIVAEPLAGLYGLASYVGTAGDFRKSVRNIEQARESLTYLPETEGAQQNLQAIGQFLSPVAEAIETVSDNSADIAFEHTGSPELAGVAAAIPLVALELAGLKGIRSTAGTAIKLKDADVRKAQKAALTDPELKYDGFVAEVKLDPKGRLVDDKVGKKLVENGIRENDVSVITNSTKPTKSQMKKMISAFEASKGNDVIAMSNKTTKPIGVSVTNRLQSLNTTRAGLGNRLDRLVKSDLGNKKIDISSSMKDINETLNVEGIKPRVNSQGKVFLPRDWYKGTIFESKTLSGVRSAIEDSFTMMSNASSYGITDLKSAHKLKKNLDLMIDASKLSESGVPGNTIRQIAKMRAKVNTQLSEVAEYGAINKELANVIQAMAPFEKYLQTGQKWSDAKVSDVVGASMKDLASDSSSSVTLVQDLSTMEKYMREAGISFGDDPKALIRFRKTLAENFNMEPNTVNTGAGRAVGSAAVSLSLGNTFGAGHDATKLIAAGMKKNEANKLAKQNKKAFNLMKMAVSEK